MNIKMCCTLVKRDARKLRVSIFDMRLMCFVFSLRLGNLSQIETLVLNVSGRILMVNKENNGNTTENLVSFDLFMLCCHSFCVCVCWRMEFVQGGKIEMCQCKSV